MARTVNDSHKLSTMSGPVLLAAIAVVLLIQNMSLAATLPTVTSGTQLLHLKADAANVVKDPGNLVSQWSDLSPTGSDFGQGAGVRQPLWVENALGGKPALRFDGVNDFLDVGLNAGLDNADAMPFTFFAVTSRTTNPKALFDSAPGQQNTFRFYQENRVEFWNADPVVPLTLQPFGSVVSVRAFDVATNRNAEVREISAIGTTSGSAAGGTSPVVFGGSGSVEISIGSINAGQHGIFRGEVSEVLIYAGKLTDADRDAVEDYLIDEFSLAFAPSPASPGNYAQTVLNSGPVGYWRLGETTATATDSASAAGAPQMGSQHGLFGGIAPPDQGRAGPRPTDLVAGQPLLGFRSDNAAVDFQGVSGAGDDVVVIPDDGNLNFSVGGALSVEAWVNAPAIQDENGVPIVGKGTGAGGEQFVLDVYNGVYRFFVRDAFGVTDSPLGTGLVSTAVAPDETWQHVVGVVDVSQNLMKLYLNGQEVGSAAAPASLLDTSHEVTIGSRQRTTGPYDLNFKGLIDEVAVYDRALSPAEVQAHFGAATVPEPSGIVLAVMGLFGLSIHVGRRRRRRAA